MAQPYFDNLESLIEIFPPHMERQRNEYIAKFRQLEFKYENKSISRNLISELSKDVSNLILKFFLGKRRMCYYCCINLAWKYKSLPEDLYSQFLIRILVYNYSKFQFISDSRELTKYHISKHQVDKKFEKHISDELLMYFTRIEDYVILCNEFISSYNPILYKLAADIASCNSNSSFLKESAVLEAGNVLVSLQHDPIVTFRNSNDVLSLILFEQMNQYGLPKIKVCRFCSKMFHYLELKNSSYQRSDKLCCGSPNCRKKKYLQESMS